MPQLFTDWTFKTVKGVLQVLHFLLSELQVFRLELNFAPKKKNKKKSEKHKKVAHLRNALPRSHSTVKLQGCLIRHQAPISPYQPSAAFHTEPSYLIFLANQVTGFYIACNTVLKCVKYSIGETKSIPAGIYLFKVNNRNTRTRCEICSKLTIKTTE